MAAELPVSGTGMTRSASTGDSEASVSPIRRRAAYKVWPFITESGRAK